MIRRFLGTGRIIPSEYFDSIGTKPGQTYYTLRNEGGFHDTADFDGNAPLPRIIDNPGSSFRGLESD